MYNTNGSSEWCYRRTIVVFWRTFWFWWIFIVCTHPSIICSTEMENSEQHERDKERSFERNQNPCWRTAPPSWFSWLHSFCFVFYEHAWCCSSPFFFFFTAFELAVLPSLLSSAVTFFSSFSPFISSPLSLRMRGWMLACVYGPSWRRWGGLIALLLPLHF